MAKGDFSRPLTKSESGAPRFDLPKNADFSLLTEVEKEEITRQARAKVEARAKADATEAFLQAEMKRLRDAQDPDEEERSVRIDVALYADGIYLDGKVYKHGEIHTVKKRVYDVLMEQMQRTMRHEDEIRSGDEYNKFYKRERNAVLSGKGVARF